MSNELKDRVYQAGVIIPILDLANSTNEFVQRQTARTIFTLSAHQRIKDMIVAEGGLLPLVHMAQSSLTRMSKKNGRKSSKGTKDVFEIQRDVAGAIANISIGRGNKEKVAESGAIMPLIALTSSASSNVQRQAARALFALAGSEKNQREIVFCKGLLPLLNLLSSSKVEVRKHAAGAVANIATNKDIKSEIIQCGALEPLLDATKSSDKHVQKQAVRGLRNLGVKDINVDVNSCEYRRFASEMKFYVDLDDNDANFCDLKIIYDNDMNNNKNDDENDGDNNLDFEINVHEIILRLRAPKMFRVLKYNNRNDKNRVGRSSKYNDGDDNDSTLTTTYGSRMIWVHLLQFLYCGVIEKFENNIRQLGDECATTFDSLEELGTLFNIDSLVNYIKYLREIIFTRKIRHLPQPFALSNPCSFLNALDKNNESNFDDVTFQTEDGKLFRLHKIIVCARCPYFRALFLSGMRESRQSTVDIPWEGAVFERIVEYMYSGTTDISPDVACDLLMASNEWDMQGLQSLVEDELGRMIDEDSVMMILSATSTVKAPRLKARCIYYLLTNFTVLDVTKAINDPSIDKSLRYDVVDKINSWGFAEKADNDVSNSNEEEENVEEEKGFDTKK